MKNTILIVDDNKVSRTVLSRILSKEYDIYSAPDGETAIRMANEHMPDLILLDILMPEIDGYQVFSGLRNSKKTAHIPIIFITGLINHDDEQKGLELGAVDYIHKPFVDTIVKLRIHNQIQIVNHLRTIEHLSMIDQLTMLPNRRNFDERLQAEWGRAIREKLPLCLLLIDIDHFKKHNDTYGHQHGDKVLFQIAQVISKTLKRPADFAARWGGEEFAVLLPNTDSKGGLGISEQIRKNIQEMQIDLDDGTSTTVTASIGFNSCTPLHESALKDFFSKSDNALYGAKETGRNRVILYDEAQSYNNSDELYDEEIPDLDVSDIIIPGINATAGTTLYSGEMDIYISVLKSFYNNIPKAIEKMNGVSEETLSDYTTIVHGLKGSCASIGATDAQEKAYTLEMKAREGDFTNLPELNAELIKDAEELLKNIGIWMEKYL